jgi:hypothetical protein
MKDRDEFEALFAALRVVLRESGAKLYAFHIDSRELHLIVRAGKVPLVSVLGKFCREATRRITHRRGDSGPIFVHRPRVILLQREKWLLPVARYVHAIRLRSDSLLSWNSDGIYRIQRRLPGLSTSAVMRAVLCRMERGLMWNSVYAVYFDTPAPQAEIHLIEHGSPEDCRILGDRTFIAGVPRASGAAAHLKIGGHESTDEVIRRAAELVISRFHALCRASLSEHDARDWIAHTDLELLRSKSRRVPLPFVRGMIADYALTRGLAKRIEIEKFFGLRPRSLTAGLRHRYRSRMLARMDARSVIAPHRIPYVERSAQGVNAELLESMIGVVLDG